MGVLYQTFFFPNLDTVTCCSPAFIAGEQEKCCSWAPKAIKFGYKCSLQEIEILGSVWGWEKKNQPSSSLISIFCLLIEKGTIAADFFCHG